MRATIAAFALVAGTACTTMPMYRPIAPPMGEHTFEVGIGPHAMFGQHQMGIGTSGYGSVQVIEDVDVVARVGAADIFTYDGSTPAFSDVLWSASAGVRGRKHMIDNLWVGAEGLIDFQQRTSLLDPGSGERYLSGIFGIPVSEQAIPGLHVYTELLLGIALPLYDGANVPFFGFQEIPIGVVWEATPWLVLCAEGGFAIPIDGGYGGVTAAFRF